MLMKTDKEAPTLAIECGEGCAEDLGSGDDTVGSPRRAGIYQLELFELVLFSKLDQQFPIEQFEATVSQSTYGTLSLSIL